MELAVNGEALAELQERISRCRLCADAGHAITEGPIFSGPATARVMVIGQAPGITESTARRPFNASSGRRLFQWLAGAGWDESTFRREHYMTAITRCYPGKNAGGRGDRVASRAEQLLCRPFLHAELTLLRPKLILTVGRMAAGLFFPTLKLDDLVGRAGPLPFNPDRPVDLPVRQHIDWVDRPEDLDALRDRDRWVIPLPHPSGASQWLNSTANQDRLKRALEHISELRRILEL
jgi:uracil-DNA glycosylase